MAERPWRTEVLPIHRVGWSDDPVAAGARTDPVAIGRRRRADPLLAALVVAAVLLALVKPWGTSRLPELAPIAPVVPEVKPVAQDAPAAASAAPLLPNGLPREVFAPAARTCMQDAGWRVCVLGAGGSAEQTMGNHFAPQAPALVDPTGKPAAAEPVVVLATMQGATLAFYAPPGLYVLDPSEAPALGDTSNGLPVITGGPVSISAWYVDDRSGSLTLSLRGGVPITQGGGTAANVFVPAADAFGALGAWTPGRYIVWMHGVGPRTWQQFFDFDVAGEATTTPR